MSRYKTAAQLLACLILAAATLRAFAFWAADPMLAYANNSDQIRTLKVFGLHPKDAPEALYATVKELLAAPQRRAEMGRNLRSMVLPDSTDRICNIVENLAKK